jgi:hypothetical protein
LLAEKNLVTSLFICRGRILIGELLF